jgi:hypothetical protein
MIRSVIDKASQAISTVSERSLAAVPNYGKITAALFLISLVGETYVRASSQKTHSGFSPWVALFLLKKVQVFSGMGGSSYSWKLTIPAGTVAFLLPSVGAARAKIWTTENAQGERLHKAAVIPTDRPYLKTYFACAYEALNVASKVIQSVATGVVAQKMWSDQTEGKVRVAVTTALLALSAWNVYNLKTYS